MNETVEKLKIQYCELHALICRISGFIAGLNMVTKELDKTKDFDPELIISNIKKNIEKTRQMFLDEFNDSLSQLKTVQSTIKLFESTDTD